MSRPAHPREDFQRERGPLRRLLEVEEIVYDIWQVQDER
jgi:hypothetical protein